MTRLLFGATLDIKGAARIIKIMQHQKMSSASPGISHRKSTRRPGRKASTLRPESNTSGTAGVRVVKAQSSAWQSVPSLAGVVSGWGVWGVEVQSSAWQSVPSLAGVVSGWGVWGVEVQSSAWQSVPSLAGVVSRWGVWGVEVQSSAWQSVPSLAGEQVGRLGCRGTEQHVAECAFSGWGGQQCTSGAEAVVECRPKGKHVAVNIPTEKIIRPKKKIVVFRYPDRPYFFAPTLKFFFRLLGAILQGFTIKMKFWCKILYFSIKRKILNKKKVPTYLPYFFLVMIPEHNFLFVLALVRGAKY